MKKNNIKHLYKKWKLYKKEKIKRNKKWIVILNVNNKLEFIN